MNTPTSTQTPTISQKALSSVNPLWAITLGSLFCLQLLFLSPTPTEDSTKSSGTIDPETLIPRDSKTLAPGIPVGRVPEYTVEGFTYTSTQNGQKQWKLLAERAHMYNTERLVHSKQVTAYLYNPNGETTLVTGIEAKYYVNGRDLEVYGDVKIVFPDGFESHSEYMRYLPETKLVEIPSQYRVNGRGEQSDGQIITFDSFGLNYPMNTSVLKLLEQVRLVMIKKDTKSLPKNQASTTPKATALKTNEPDTSQPPTPGVPDQTIVEADHCTIMRDKRIAYFIMDEARPIHSRFVTVNQPSTFIRSRRAELNYGDFTKILQYMIAYDDVLVKERPTEQDRTDLKDSRNSPRATKVTHSKKSNSTPLAIASITPVQSPSPVAQPVEPQLRYSTSGRADFDTQRDVVILTIFPQVYQDNDTITGDLITLHRDTDVVEVENSNAYSEGKSN